MKYDLVIMTTSITRPELHSQCLPDFINSFEGLNVLWLINIDCINDKINETKENFKNMVQKHENIEIKIFIEEDPCFYKAFKRLAIECKKYLNQTNYFMILEDDWKLLKLIKIKDHLPLEERSYFVFNNKMLISFNPSIWSKDIFKEYIIDRIENSERCDPENICCGYKGSSFEKIKFKKIGKLVQDIGRLWSQQNGLKKWIRSTNGTKTYRTE